MSSMLQAPLQPSLPLPGSAKAPSFDGTQPHTLERFFDDLEFIFERSQVVNADRKRFVGRYIPYDVEELWTSLPEWSPTSTASFAQFRAAVSALYPEVRPDRKFAYRHLEELVDEWQAHEFSSLEDYGCFYRSFFRISSYLRQKEELGVAEEGRLFKQVFPAKSRFRRRLSNRLRLKFPDQHLTDVFTLVELHAAAVYVLQGVEAHAFPPSTRVRQSLPTPAPIVEPNKPPAFTPKYPLVAAAPESVPVPAPEVAMQIVEVLPMSSVEEPSVDLPVDECHYCGASKCYIRSCPAVVADISSGQCTRNPDGRVVLPSGRFVPRSLPGRTMRERVLEWHRRNPKVADSQAADSQVHTSRLVLDPSASISKCASRVFQAPWNISRPPSLLSPPFRRMQNVSECVQEDVDEPMPNPAPEWMVRSWSQRAPEVVNQIPLSPPASHKCSASSMAGRPREQSQQHSWRAPCENPELIEQVVQRILKIPIQLSAEELAACTSAWSTTTVGERVEELSEDAEQIESRPCVAPEDDSQSCRAPCEDPAVIERVVQKILNIPIQLSAKELAACASVYARSPATSVGELEESSEDLQQSESRPSVAARFPILPLFPFNRDNPSLHSQSFTSMAWRETQ